MKNWIAPTMEQLNFNLTATVGMENESSGMVTTQLDLGTCNNPYWEGNKLTIEEALENNPFWAGEWGK